MNLSLSLLLALGGLVFAFLISRSEKLTFATIILTYSIFEQTFKIHVDLGGFSFFVIDLTMVVLALAIAFKRDSSRIWNRSIFFLLALVTASVLVGAARDGLATSINGNRNYIYLLVTIAYGSQCVSSFERLEQFWIWFGAITMATAYIFFFQNGLATFADDQKRALNSMQALALSMAMIFALGRISKSSRRWILYLALALFAIVACQQRTVWIATGAMILVVMLRQNSRSIAKIGSRSRRALGALLGISMVGAFFAPQSLLKSVESATSTVSTSGDTTFGWRFIRWQEYLREFLGRDLSSRLFGDGGSWALNSRVGIATHNMYIEALMSVGFVGLVALLWLIATSLSRSSSAKYGDASYVCIVGLIVYGFGYSWPSIGGFVIGTAVASVHFHSEWRRSLFSAGVKNEDFLTTASSKNLKDK